MKSVVFFFSHLLFILFLTILTQIGGLIWLLNWGMWAIYKQTKGEKSISLKIVSFLFLYIFFSFLLLPPLAKLNGRVPLPLNGDIYPANITSCMMNRHYVCIKVKKVLQEAVKSSSSLQRMAYLDAGFPFWNGFPLFPHLSHYDGKKVDLAFYYIDKHTGFPCDNQPSNSGYGVFEFPQENEQDEIAICKKEGFYLYDFTKYLTFGSNPTAYSLDMQKTQKCISFFCKHKDVKKILLETHLKTRLSLEKESKIRKPGCHAVRHDDHIHLEVY